ncbi:MAG: prepilin-type N-terminal cleavage/methylation domain-containing protein [Acidimicrobiales bacterium]
MRSPHRLAPGTLRRAAGLARRAHAHCVARPGDDAGFTLVELLVAITIFVVVAVAAAMELTGAFAATVGNRQRIVAGTLVSQTLGSVESTPFTSITKLDGNTMPQTVDGTTYTITEHVRPVSPPKSPGGNCTFNAAGTDGEFLMVEVSVTWTGKAVAPAVGQVEMSPPASVISAGYANEAVQVVGSDGKPIPKVELSIGGSNPQTKETDANGCASFIDLLPGATYTITAATSSGLIDQAQADQGISPPVAQWTTPNVLTANSYNSTVLDWDLPATVTPGLSVPAGDTTPATCTEGGSACAGFSASPLAMPVGLQALTSTGGNGPDALTGVTAPANVYPFSAGWRTWAGDCAGSDPGPTAGAGITTSPGTSVTGQAPLFTPTLTSAAALEASATITATCTNGESLTYTVASGGTGPFPLAVPPGTWTFSTVVNGKPEKATVAVTGPGAQGKMQ